MTHSTANGNATPVDVRTVAEHRHRLPRITRRGVQVGLGVLWLVDAALQMQPRRSSLEAVARQ